MVPGVGYGGASVVCPFLLAAAGRLRTGREFKKPGGTSRTFGVYPTAPWWCVHGLPVLTVLSIFDLSSSAA